MTYKSKRPPRAKQAEALKLSKGKEFFALAMARRVGKTKVVIDEWGETLTSNEPMNLLVIAPGGVYRTWLKALDDELPTGKRERIFEFLWDSDRIATTKIGKLELETFLRPLCNRPQAFFINIESLSSVKRARDAVLSFLQLQRSAIVAVDESVTIKNDSKCAEFVIDKVGPLAARRRILTGLITPRSPLDVYRQYRFLSKAIVPENFSDFRDRYAIVKRLCTVPNKVVRLKLTNLMRTNSKRPNWIASKLFPKAGQEDISDNPFMMSLLQSYPESCTRDEAVDAIFKLGGWIQSIPVVDGYQRLDELQDRLAPHTFSVKLEDCYDMPASDYSFWDVAMTPEQEHAYEGMKRHGIAELEKKENDKGYVTASDVIVQMMRLHQIVLGHTREDGEKDDTQLPENRTTELVKCLEGYDGQAVIWCCYQHDIKRVSEALRKTFGSQSVANFYGGNVRTREQESEDFQAGRRTYMVGTPDAGRYGRAWGMADLTLFHGCKNNLDHRLQAEDRTKAVGKTHMCSYIDFRCRDTVEEGIIQALRDKVNLAERVEGKKWRNWL